MPKVKKQATNQSSKSSSKKVVFEIRNPEILTLPSTTMVDVSPHSIYPPQKLVGVLREFLRGRLDLKRLDWPSIQLVSTVVSPKKLDHNSYQIQVSFSFKLMRHKQNQES